MPITTFSTAIEACLTCKKLNQEDPRTWLPWMDYVVCVQLNGRYCLLRRFFAQAAGAKIVA